MSTAHEFTAELFIHLDCELGEGPRWDPTDQSLLFVDVLAGRLYRARTSDSAGSGAPFVTRVNTGQPLGAANLRAEGGLILAMRDGIYLAEQDATEPSPFAAIELDIVTNRMNDAACDPQGRLWAGTMSFEAEADAGTLYRIDPDGTVTAVLRDLTISNGLGWSPAGDLMYFIDSPTRRIDVFDFNAEQGSVRRRRTFIDLSQVPGVPDGMTIDTDGGLWVAFWGGAQVRRFGPDAVLTDIVHLPVPQPTSCTFGGTDGKDLYITSARIGLSQSDLADSPLSGSVFVARPGHRGLPAFSFGSR